MKTIYLVLTFISLSTLASCVSVNLPGSSKGLPAKNTIVAEPGSDFIKSKKPTGDQTWINKKTRNIISYITECGSSDPSLESMYTEVISALQNPEEISTKTSMFNEREALFTETKGKIDGVPVQISSLVFKKNSCNYVITLSGQTNSVEKDRKTFDSFLKGFKAQ